MTIHLGWPQIIYIALSVLGLVDCTINHGKPRLPYNAWSMLSATIIYTLLLWWGGFFG